MIFIPLNVSSSKNSRVWTGKYFVVSKLTRKYIESTHLIWEINKEKFLAEIGKVNPPYIIEFYFIRDSKRKFDYINATQVLADLMKKHEWLEDDNCDIIKPIYKGYHVDKKNCGVEIRVVKSVKVEYL